MSVKCNDPVVGRILAGWRYDISGLAAEMRGDYDDHLAHCPHCKGKQRLHRTIDVGLIVVATISAGVFVIAFAAVRHFAPRHALWLELGALVGFVFSSLMWIIVAIATPAPVVMVGAAKEGARRVHERLPEEIRSRIPLPTGSQDLRS